MSQRLFFFGEWQVNPESNSIRQDEKTLQLEPRAMDVLVFLCRHANQVFSADDLLQQVWAGAVLGDNPVHKTIAQLRKALGDDASQPRFIETIRKRGYRAIAPVVFPVGDAQAVSEGLWQQGSPFPGLRAFEAKDAGVFFGRGEQINALLKSIALHARQARSLHIVLGPSGSGKTSLVNAGIIPNLVADHGFDGIHVLSAATVDMADVTESRLYLDLASALLDWEINDDPVFAGISAEVLAGELQTNLDKLVALFSSIMATQVEQKRYQLLLVDRLEALLSAPQFPEAARAQVVRIMDSFASSGAAIVIATCRNDFYPMLAQHKALMTGKSTGAHFDLLPPSRAELLQMIRLPAKAAQLTWESDSSDSLDQLLCDDAAESPDALPMLQYTLNELYQQRGEDNELKLAHYRALGGIEGAIGKRAEAIYNDQPESVKTALPQIFAKLVSLSNDEKSITSRAALWSQLGSEHQRQLVQALVDNRLLVSHLVGDEPGFSLAHEALLRRWPRAVEWIHQHRYNIKIKSRLSLAAERWLSEKEAKEFLIPDGKPLFEAKEIEQNSLFALSENEQRYIQQSSKRSRNRKLIKHATVASLALLTMLSVAMTWRSVEAEQRAEERRAQADNLLGFMVGEFADKLRELGRMDLLESISARAISHFSEESSIDGDFSSDLIKAMALNAISESAYSRRNYNEVTKAAITAIHLLSQYNFEDEFTVDATKQLGAAYFWKGQVHFDKHEYEAAIESFTNYYKSIERAQVKHPDSNELIIELSYAENSLGSVYFNLKQLSKASEHFFRSYELKKRALEKAPNDTMLLYTTADTISWLASLSFALEDFEESYKYRTIEQQIIKRQLDEDPSSMLFLGNLAQSLYAAAGLQVELNNIDLASSLVEESKTIYRRLLLEDKENTQIKINFILANALSSTVALDSTKSAIEEADVNEAMLLLNSNLSTGDIRRDMISALFDFSRHYEAVGNSTAFNRTVDFLLSTIDEHNIYNQLDSESRLRIDLLSLLKKHASKVDFDRSLICEKLKAALEQQKKVNRYIFRREVNRLCS